MVTKKVNKSKKRKNKDTSTLKSHQNKLNRGIKIICTFLLIICIIGLGKIYADREYTRGSLITMYNIKGNEGMCDIIKNGTFGDKYNVEMSDDGYCALGTSNPDTKEYKIDCSWIKIKIYSTQEKIKIREKILFKLIDCEVVN